MIYKGRSQENNKRNPAGGRQQRGTEEAEAEWRNTNRGIKVRIGGGSLVEEGGREEPTQEKLSPKTRALTYTHFTSSLCVLWRVREATLWWLSLFFGDDNYEWMDARTQLHNFNRSESPSLSSGEVVVAEEVVCATYWRQEARENHIKKEGSRFKEMCERS